jgi:hypothetical protein
MQPISLLFHNLLLRNQVFFTCNPQHLSQNYLGRKHQMQPISPLFHNLLLRNQVFLHAIPSTSINIIWVVNTRCNPFLHYFKIKSGVYARNPQHLIQHYLGAIGVYACNPIINPDIIRVYNHTQINPNLVYLKIDACAETWETCQTCQTCQNWSTLKKVLKIFYFHSEINASKLFAKTLFGFI